MSDHKFIGVMVFLASLFIISVMTVNLFDSSFVGLLFIFVGIPFILMAANFWYELFVMLVDYFNNS